MAGVTAAGLAAAVANAGGMGALGALMTPPDEIRGWAREVRSQSNGPFQLNLWIPDPPPARNPEHEARVRKFLGDWGPLAPPEAGNASLPDFDAQCDGIAHVNSHGVAHTYALNGCYCLLALFVVFR